MNLEYKSKNELVEDKIIEKFKNSKDNRLPSEIELAHMMGVSRTTVRAAMVRLSAKGYINKRSRIGNFFLGSVVDTPNRLELSLDYIKLIRENGYTPSMIYTDLGKVSGDSVPTDKLSLAEGEQLHYSRWEYKADEESAILVHYYVPEHFFPVPPPERTYVGDEASTTIFKTYAGQEYSHFIVFLDVTCDEETNRFFGLEAGKHLLTFREYLYNINDEPFAYSESRINPNLFEFSMVNIWGE